MKFCVNYEFIIICPNQDICHHQIPIIKLLPVFYQYSLRVIYCPPYGLQPTVLITFPFSLVKKVTAQVNRLEIAVFRNLPNFELVAIVTTVNSTYKKLLSFV